MPGKFGGMEMRVLRVSKYLRECQGSFWHYQCSLECHSFFASAQTFAKSAKAFLTVPKHFVRVPKHISTVSKRFWERQRIFWECQSICWECQSMFESVKTFLRVPKHFFENAKAFVISARGTDSIWRGNRSQTLGGPIAGDGGTVCPADFYRYASGP